MRFVLLLALLVSFQGITQAQESSEDLEISTAPASVPAGESSSQDDEVDLAPEYKTYTVWLWQEKRDCLWTIAKRFYGDPWLWKKIYQANREQIEDPGVIYPKQVLLIPPREPQEQ